MIMITAEEAMQTLYQMAGTQSYAPRIYSTTSRQFRSNPILEPQVKEFKLNPLLVPPPGSDPGSPDFQSGAMTTSAKEA
jgi:hypothetical protein